MSTWYTYAQNVERLEKEAGFKEDVMVAILAVGLLGGGLAAKERVEKATGLDLPDDTRLEQQMQQTLDAHQEDPQTRAFLARQQDQAQILADEIRNQMPVDEVYDPERKKEPASKEINWASAAWAISQVESGGDPNAEGEDGERGLMQIKPDTWDFVNKKWFGGQYPFEKHAFDPIVNKGIGTRYLRYLYERNNGDLQAAFAQYNAGKNKEDYAQRVMNLYEWK